MAAHVSTSLMACVLLVVTLSAFTRSEVVSGELRLDVGMEFNPSTKKIIRTTHHFRVTSDSGEDISLDVDDAEKELLMKRGPSARVSLNGTRGRGGFKGRVSGKDDHRGQNKRQTGWLVSPRMTALGEMNVLFFLVNLQSTDTRYQWASAAMPAALPGTFDRLRAEYLRTSWGQLSLVSKKRDGTFAFYGLYNTGVAPSCTSASSTMLGPIATAVQTKFADDAWWNGYNGQTMHVFFWPSQMSTLCGSAWGTVGHPGNVWSELSDYLLEHEFGHVIGMYHAGLATGTTAEYGDCSDVMGCLASSSTPINLITGGSHNNGPHKVSVGWTRDQPVREVKLTTTATTVSISLAPISRATTTIPQIVSMGRADAYGTAFPGLGSHFISYRVPDATAGIEDNIPPQYRGVNIHEQTVGRSFFLGVLNTAGQVFEITGKPDMYARITLVSISATQANIKVSYMPLSSSAPPPVTTPLQFFPLTTPVRLVDTRATTNPGVYTGSGAFTAGQTRLYYVAGYPGTAVPASARALSIDLTVLAAGAAGHMSIWPNGAAQPTSSCLNYVAGQSISAASYPALGTNGGLKLFSLVAVNLVLDVTGYFAPATTGGLWFKPLPKPVRMIDTRVGQSAIYRTGAQVPAGGTLTKPMRVGGVAATAAAISVTVGLLERAGPGWLGAYAGGSAFPGTIIGYTTIGVSVEAAGISRLNPTDGSMSLISSNAADLVVDCDGYFDPGTGVGFVPLTAPIRLVDTRAGAAALYSGSGVIAALTARTFTLAGVTYKGISIPSTATVVVGTVTPISTGAAGYLTVYPAGAAQPHSTAVLYGTSGAVAQGNHMAVGSNRGVTFYSLAAIHLVVDITGYYAPVTGIAPGEIVRADTTSSSSGSSLSGGVLAAIIIAGVLTLAAIAAAVAVGIVRYRRLRARHAAQLQTLIPNEDI